MTEATGGREAFVRRVAGVLGARIVGFVFSVSASLLTSRLLDRDGQGAYTTATTVVGLVFTFAQLGLPSSLTFFASRRRTLASLRRAGFLVGSSIAFVAVVLTVALLPAFEGSIARSATGGELLLGIAALPVLLLSSIGGGILYGRRRIRTYTLIQVAQSAASLVGVVIIVGLLHGGVLGAIGAYVLANGLGAAAVVREVWRLDPAGGPDERPTSARELVGYGARLYPSSITSYFNYRADVLILNALRTPDAQIGLYGRAVNFAELLFYVPDSISAILYPTVAASSNPESHRIAPAVPRFTALVALIAAIGLVPTAYLAIAVVLPRFTGSMVPLVILLPGIVSLSLSKVLSSYISGLGRPGATTIAATIAMVVNVLANLVLIPVAGIAGAAAASLLSYTLQAAILVVVASRLSGMPVRMFVVPGRDEVRRALAIPGALRAQMLQGRARDS